MYQLGLIGYPIKHSFSPWIHTHFLEKTGISGTYKLLEIQPDSNFETEMKKLKTEGLNGFNITVPYKQAIIPYLDELDSEAERIGAVNTVKYSDGKWIGYNTDGIGYVRSLKSKYPKLFINKSNKILILGAGGAARGIYDALVNEGFKYVDIANRTLESAEKIAQLKLKYTKTNTMTLQEAEQVVSHYDAIIQTTSVGMAPRPNEVIINLRGLQPHTIVSDIVYQPIETQFLTEARYLGASIHLGHTMLLYQAQYAFEIWTEMKAPIDQLDDELQNKLMEGR